MTTDQARRLQEALIDQDATRRALVGGLDYGREEALVDLADRYIEATDRCFRLAVEVSEEARR